MRAIFISYRRQDTEAYAGRLFDYLSKRFGKEMVFMDVADIQVGRDFRVAIEQQVTACGVLLAVIGKNWLTAADDEGRRKLDDPKDFVRVEIAHALKRDIPVVPVRVNGAQIPKAELLPDDLKELTYRNGVELTHARWESDVQALINAMQRHMEAASDATQTPTPPPSQSPKIWRLAAVASVLVIIGVGVYLALRNEEPSAVVKPEEKPVAITKDENLCSARTDPATLDCEQLWLARNQIYACHGYHFSTSKAQEYFTRQPWYHASSEDNQAIVNAMGNADKAAIDRIRSYESQKHCASG